MISAAMVREASQKHHIALSEGQAHVVVADLSETEPLLASDTMLAMQRPLAVLGGLRLAMLSAGASRGVLFLRSKLAARLLAQHLGASTDIALVRSEDVYLPKKTVYLREALSSQLEDYDAVLSYSVSALVALFDALRGQQQRRVLITVAGAVDEPAVWDVPLGTSLTELAARAQQHPKTYLWYGSALQGRLVGGADPVHSDARLLLVLPEDHLLIQREKQPRDVSLLRMASACAQCAACTELCPSYLTGHPFRPQQVLLALTNKQPLDTPVVSSAVHCDGCGICEAFACPVGLLPASVLRETRKRLAQTETPLVTEQLLPGWRERRIPLVALAARLGLGDYQTPSRLRIW